MLNEIVQLLKSKGAEDEYPLHTAAMIEDIKTLKRLLNEENANVGSVDRGRRRTAFHYAAEYNKKNLDVLNCLLNHKTFSIDVLNEKDTYRYTVLMYAGINDGPIKREIIQLIKSKGAKAWEVLSETDSTGDEITDEIDEYVPNDLASKLMSKGNSETGVFSCKKPIITS